MNSINGNKIGFFGIDSPKEYDQAIITKKYPFLNKIRLRIYNQDGSETDMCGNAIILVAKDYFKKNKKKKLEIVLNQRTVNCSLKNNKIYCNFGNKWSEENQIINLDNLHYFDYGFNTPKGCEKIISKFCNYHLIEKFSPQKKVVYIKTIEKGAGNTLSCGSGAMATFLYFKECFRCQEELKVVSKGGCHYVKIDENNNIYLIYENE
jgi:diaminopimelate epimerase